MNAPAPPADNGGDLPDVVARLGFAAEQIVQEVGWDDDVDNDVRFAVEDIVGSDLEDEDYTGEVDAVVLWWRDEDGDLTDALITLVGVLGDGGFVVALTPKDADAGAVDAAELDEAATTAGLHTAGAFPLSPTWRATKLVATKARR